MILDKDDCGKLADKAIEFTKDQQKAFDELSKFINSPYNSFDWKRALVGAGGVGKTFLIKSLILNSNISHSLIGLSTPTHKACRVLKDSIGDLGCHVSTLQSDLGLRVNFDVEKFDINNPPFDPKGKIKVGEYQLYIIDEASMINKGLLRFMERYLKENKVKVIYCGDTHQLCPVNETSIAAFNGIKVCRLTQIVRQDEDNPLVKLLDMLRYDIEHKSFTFLNYIYKRPQEFDESNLKGYKLMNAASFANEVTVQYSDSQILNDTDSIRILAYTNMCVSSWNKFVRNCIVSDDSKSVINRNDLITSYTTIVDNFNSAIIKNSEDYIIHDIVNYTHPKYNIKGFMIKFQAIHGGIISKPVFVVDHSDSFSMKMYLKVANELIDKAKNSNRFTRSTNWKNYYAFKDSCLLATNVIRTDGTVLYTRDLDYGFAQTVYKAQGSTYDNVMIDLRDIVYDKNGKIYTNAEEINRRLYVALSRAKYKAYLKL